MFGYGSIFLVFIHLEKQVTNMSELQNLQKEELMVAIFIFYNKQLVVHQRRWARNRKHSSRMVWREGVGVTSAVLKIRPGQQKEPDIKAQSRSVHVLRWRNKVLHEDWVGGLRM